MPTIDTEFSLANPVQVRGAGSAWIAGTVLKIHHGEWMSQPVQNRFYVLFNAPVNEIGDWYAASQVFPNGITNPGTFASIFGINDPVFAPDPYGGVVATTCVGLHYGPINWPASAAIEVQCMLIYDDPQPFGTGRWHSELELGG